MRKIKKILIANRGEVASRIIKTCKKLLIETVAIFSPSDSKFSYISESDYAFSLDSNELFSSYLDQEKILKIALANNCDAIHAGYGFLSENYEFAKKCTDSGVVFIAPDEGVLKICGDKNKSKELAKKIGINVIDSFEVDFSDEEKILKSTEEFGFPLLIKASFGGGGKGIKVVYNEKNLIENILLAKNEAYSSFGKSELIIEKYLPNVKHIEIQILGDSYGNYIHLFERECSIQRRFQKIIEEAPSSLNDTVLENIFTSALKLAKELNYTNAGTIEFFVEPNGDFYFSNRNLLM